MTIKENELLSRHVNFRIGGPAKYWCEAKSADEIAEAITLAKERGWKWAVIGGGSNTLPSDDGFDGLVIQAANRGWRIDNADVYAEAGVLSTLLARKTAEVGLTGFEWAASLPGTIGGAVRGDAGCFGGEMREVVTEVRALTKEGIIKSYTKAECEFAYRDSIFKRNGEIVVSAKLHLSVDAPKECLERIEWVLGRRKTEQPFGQASAGCMFKNFEFQDEADILKLSARVKVPEPFMAAKRIPAGWLIEEAGLKGTTIGDAQVSDLHANFLVNRGSASASEIIQLLSLVKMKVRNEFGVQLEEEVQLLGF